MRLLELFSAKLDAEYRRKIEEAVAANQDKFRVDDNGNVSVNLENERFRQSFRQKFGELAKSQNAG